VIVPSFSVMQSTPPISTSSTSRVPQYLGQMVRTARLSAIAVVALTGCATNSTSGENCVPRVQIEPAAIHPGNSITVVSADSCNVKIPGAGWIEVAGQSFSG
jgi:uncharacterized lipoprotein YajG